MHALNTWLQKYRKKPLISSNEFSLCLGGGGNTEVLFQTHPPSFIIYQAAVQTRMKWAFQKSPMLMARVMVIVFSLTGWQLFSKALNVSAFFPTRFLLHQVRAT